MKKQKRLTKSRRPWLTALKISLIVIFSAIILVAVAGGAVFVYYAKDAPKLDLAKLESADSTKVYDSKNELIATLGGERRDLVQTDNIPVILVNAVTSIEDRRFFSTRGIDPIRIAGAFINNVRGGALNGGSTLDMQLIKLSFFSTSTSDQTLRVKVQEAWLALQMDQKWTKEQIFTAYVNKVNMANGYYGMGTASQAYYGKPLTQLSVAQIALLAGMPQAPTTYNPYVNPDQAKWRRDMVINAMYKYEKISKEERDKALATPIKDGLQPLKPSSSVPDYADNFLKQAIAQANQIVGKDVTSDSVKIYTTMDNNAQQNLYNIVNTNNFVNFPDDSLQVASTVINTKTGAVVAQIGGRKQNTNETFRWNQAVQTDRDWGSTMKPIVDYAPAFENGVYKSTGTYIADTGPYYYPSGGQLNDWDNQYLGNITVRQALALSRNIPAIKTLASVGLDNADAFVKKLGINFGSIQWSNGISSNQTVPEDQKTSTKFGASSEKMAAAYAAFGNGGVYTEPYYITKIVYADGREEKFEPKRSRAMKAETAYAITDILKDVIKGKDGTIPSLSTGIAAQTPGLPEAGKTGTSNYRDVDIPQALANIGMTADQAGSISPDENFVGFTPNYSMAIWTGYKDKLQPIWGDKIFIAPKTFKAMMQTLQPDPSAVPDWEMPTGVSRIGSELNILG